MRRPQQELRAGERRFKTLARSAPVGIFETDADGNCLFVNHRRCRKAGMTPEALEMIEAELRDRGVGPEQLAEHAERCRQEVLFLPDGTAARKDEVTTIDRDGIIVQKASPAKNADSQ